MDIKFNEGDFVKNRDGRIGYISHICRCDECKKRGFFEPTIKYTIDGSEEDISKSMLANVPVNYKQIGTQIFGDEFIIEKLREDNDKLNDLVKFQEKQIERLQHKIECMKKDEDKMINIKLPCPIGTILYDVDTKEEYIITKYEIRGLKNLLFAVCNNYEDDNSNVVLFNIKNGRFVYENVFIAELPDYELTKCIS